MTSSAENPGVVTAAAAFGLVALTVYLLVVGESILMPLVLAIFIAYLISALGNRLERIKIGSWHPPGWLGLSGAILILFMVLAIAAQFVAGNINDMIEAAPGYQTRLEEMFTEGTAFAAKILRLKEPPTFTALAQHFNFYELVQSLAIAFQSMAANTFQVFAYVAFLLLEIRTFDRKLKLVIPEAGKEKRVRAMLGAMSHKIETYVLIKSCISLLNAIFSYIILISFGVNFAGFWALLVFVLNFIPYIGSPLAMLFPTVLALLQFASFVVAALVLGCLAGVQAFVENVIEPQLTGKSLNLSPVVMILSLSIWGAIWGVTGMILSVPLMVITMIVLAQFPKTRPIAVVMSANGDLS